MKTETISLRYLFEIFSGSTPDSGKGFYWDGETPWITPEDVNQISSGYYIEDTKRKITDEGFNNSGVKMAPKNSIVLTKRAPIGNIAILKLEACCNQGCFLLVPKENVHTEFYYFFLLSKKSYLQALGRGSTFMELSTDDIKSLKVPKLSYDEQVSISETIKKEINKIDELIQLTEDNISFLKERRWALRSNSVIGKI